MNIRPLSFHGAWEITPQQHGDPRGLFLEWYRFDKLEAEVGHPMRLAQANMSVSSKDVVRGIHFADVPMGQSKYVTCVRGAVLDVVVDLRVGSPTFGRWEGVRLDDVDRRALYIAEGMGHGFCALSDDATLSYLVSDVFRPDKEHGVHPLDPELGIDWPTGAPQLSARDAAAPSLAEMREGGRLPDFDVCQAHYKELGAGA
ncbi:dTDP-4-dehydrorhamnose 3,5-epimerase [Streptomyces sp. SPB162]|nr:dTDP-4-dehydrorhamnose 3,5-epimerase [Streptomyces sp. SPB162]